MKAFRTFGLLAATTLTLTLPAQAYWDPWQADDLFGHSAVNVVDTIETSEGVEVERVESWGELVVATVVDENAGVEFRYFDPKDNFSRVHLTSR